jgi:hypothetical protein
MYLKNSMRLSSNRYILGISSSYLLKGKDSSILLRITLA